MFYIFQNEDRTNRAYDLNMERFCERHGLGRARKNGYTDAHPTKIGFGQKMLPNIQLFIRFHYHFLMPIPIWWYAQWFEVPVGINITCSPPSMITIIAQVTTRSHMLTTHVTIPNMRPYCSWQVFIDWVKVGTARSMQSLKIEPAMVVQWLQGSDVCVVYLLASKDVHVSSNDNRNLAIVIIRARANDDPGLSWTTLLILISFMYFHVLYSTIQRHDPSLPRSTTPGLARLAEIQIEIPGHGEHSFLP